MNNRQIVDSFLEKYNHNPETLNTEEITKALLEEMDKGLNGDADTSLLMIPTYLSATGIAPLNEKVVAIDAGGTNLRIAHVTLKEDGPVIENLRKQKMFGVETQLTKEEFLNQIALLLKEYLVDCDKVGFCFSFPSEILPNCDGKVINFNKDVKITGCEGMILGKEINEELHKIGVNKDVKFVILNDTVSTLLGGKAITSANPVAGEIGLILGTGTNTAYIEKCSNITKLPTLNDGEMIINMETGQFDKFPVGEFDKRVDEKSSNPGDHKFEKAISGIYLGNVICETLKQAQNDGLFTSESHFNDLENFGMETVDKFLRNPFGDNPIAKACGNENDAELAYIIADKGLERASKLVACNLAACIIKMDQNKKLSQPTRIMAEGSTFYKCFSYRDRIDYYMRELVINSLHRNFYFESGDDVNLIGSAEAVLLNS